MSGSDVHNVQISLTQIPRVQKLNETQLNNAANQGQVLAGLAENRRAKESTQVRELEETDATEREEPKKRKERKNRDGRHIDITV